MKVVHVSYSDAGGGADIAARRLHLALREAGVDSHMLCLYSSGKTPGARGVRRRTRGIGARLAARLRFELRRIQRDPTCGGLSINWLRNAMPARIRALEPDVVHLHWLGMGTLRIEDLPRLPGQLVWTVHDMWPFCGAEHYTFRDTRWREGYTWANRAEQARGLDVNRWVWRRKWRAWQGRTIHTISVSSWMDACVRESRLFRDRPGERVVIGNGIDLDVYRPAAPTAADESAPGQARPVRLLFGAVSHFLPVKGADLLQAALDELDRQGMPFELTVFGSDVPAWLRERGARAAGYVDDPRGLADLYRSADLFLMPSRMESFGQTAAEAMACGVPVVCFDATGLRDVVDHKENGYRARAYDPGDLAAGVRWAVADAARYRHLCASARDKAERAFSIRDAAARTHAFYLQLCRDESAAAAHSASS